jgi:hypothetical protein
MFDPFLSDWRPGDNSRVRGAVFGEVTGHETMADMQDLLTSTRYKMTQMAAALGQVNPMTVKDPKALAALMVDAGNLKTRVSKADEAASIVVYNPLLPQYTTSQLYNGLLKAMRQGAPPSSAPIQRGDFDDVVNRIKQIGGVTVDLSQMPQPRGQDPLWAAVRQIPGALVPNTPLPNPGGLPGSDDLKEAFDLFKWLHDHKTEVMVVGLLVGGIIVWQMLPHVIPAAKLAGRAYLLPEATAATAVKHAARTMLLGA